MAEASAAGGRQKALLVVLLGLLVVVIWYHFGDVLTGGAGEATSEQEIARLDARLNALGELPGIPLEKPMAAEGYEAQRNLFDFGESPEARRARELAAQRREAQEEQLEEQRERAAAARERELARREERPSTPPKPRPPRFEYEYQGYVRKMPSEVFIAFLEKPEGKQVKRVPAEVGDTIDDTFVVKAIDEDAVVIGYTSEKFEGQTETVQKVQSTVAGGRGRR